MPTLNFVDLNEEIFDLKTRVFSEMSSTKNCMNEACRTVNSTDLKKGWNLKSGGFATLCTSCGSAYENSVFCETYHSEESGWRECRICGKLVHCGCIASKYLYEYMDFGGIGCGSCVKLLEIQSAQKTQIPCDVKDSLPLVDESRIETERLRQLTNVIGVNTVTSAFDHHRVDEPLLKTVENSKCVSESIFGRTDNNRSKQEPKNFYETLAHSSLGFSLSTPSSTMLPFREKISEGNQLMKGSFKARHSFLKPPKPSSLSGSEISKGTGGSQPRVPRPPAEGRGRNQLLPRYWPRITDKELQQLSGDLKTTIVPLFEKILSASDAGRIGRLVLPKACAEAYFPTINQSEGIPIKIQDVKGKEWTFQFRFWPNNNSRMYVLEGVTPCIQNMQLQAGDTVIFSQRDPGGQLVIGCRKAKTNNVEVKDSVSPADHTDEASSESLFSSSAANLPSNLGSKSTEDSQQRKKSKNIKNKRLLMHNDDATELRITWEEAQELLRPSSSAKPTIVLVDGFEFEEFQEPPIFGKRMVLTGEQEQLTQCENCHKWRQLPGHAVLSANWDLSSCTCSALESINPKDSIRTDNKKPRKLFEEPTGLDALATAAVLGESVEIGETSIGPTTRHPRHRPGCSCIVCIQPPSGKGKHEPTCKCNVCLTVRRRFKTLMMRKKKRQTEREITEGSQNKDKSHGVKSKTEDIDAVHALIDMNHESKIVKDSEETMKGKLDLNFDPRHEDEVEAGMSLTTLINAAVMVPLDVYSNGGSVEVNESGSSFLVSEKLTVLSKDVMVEVKDDSG